MSLCRAAALVLFLLAGCGGRSPDRATDSAGRTFALAAAGRARIVVDGYSMDAHVLADAAAALARYHGVRRAEVGDDTAPRCVLATTDSALGRELLAQAGITALERGGFVVGGHTFDGDLDLVRLALADPRHLGLPLVALIANRPALLARVSALCEFSPRERFECHRAGHLALWGRIEGNAPIVEGDVTVLRAAWAGGPNGSVNGLAWRAADASAHELFADELAHLDRGADVGADVGADSSPSAWTLVLHSDAAAFAAVFGSLRLVVAEPLALEVHRLFVPGCRVSSVLELRRGLADADFDLEDVLEPSGARDAPTRDVRLRGAGLALPSDRAAFAEIGSAFLELADLGADAVVLRYMVPLATDVAPSFGRTWRSEAANASSVHREGEIWFAASAAHAAGLAVILEPSFVGTPTSDLVARRKRADEGARLAFETNWSDAVASAALCAARVDARALVLGSNLPTITRTSSVVSATEAAQPALEVAIRARLASTWQRAIEAARREFGGALLYAAGDLSELERADFVAQLDAIAIEHYAPLADGGGERRSADFLGAERWSLGRVRRATGNRPLVVLGAGMPAAADSPRDPRLPRGAFDESVQAAFLTAFTRALDELEPPVAGVFLWEWTVEPTRRGGRGFDVRRPGLEAPLRALLAPR